MEADDRRKWTLLTSHGHVLVEIARNPRVRVREISAIIGITERAAQTIIADLERAGYVERLRIGRRTHYVVHADNPFRHSAQDGLRVGPFLELLTGPTSGSEATDPACAPPAAAAPAPEFPGAERTAPAEVAEPTAPAP